jgi:hypothetical protein
MSGDDDHAVVEQEVDEVGVVVWVQEPQKDHN